MSTIWENVVQGKLEGLRECLTMSIISESSKDTIRIEIRTLENVVQTVRDLQ